MRDALECPNCRRRLIVPVGDAREPLRCPRCRAEFRQNAPEEITTTQSDTNSSPSGAALGTMPQASDRPGRPEKAKTSIQRIPKSLETRPTTPALPPRARKRSTLNRYLDRIPPRTRFLAKAFLFGMCHPLVFLFCCGLAGGLSGDARSDLWLMVFLLVISAPFCGLLWVMVAASMMRYKGSPIASDAGARREGGPGRGSDEEPDDRIMRSPSHGTIQPHPDNEEPTDA
jgi:hypothetical protein